MANQSKFSTKTRGYFDTLPYTCYECAHTWEPSCIISWYDTLKDSMKFSLKIYVGFYMLSLLLKLRKKENRNMKIFKKLCRDILQSSVFLSMNGTLFLVFYCIFRHIFGKFYIWHGLLAAAVGGSVSIRIERKSRRGLLAIYLANLASETLFKMAVSRNLVHAIPNGEVFIFMIASSGFMALYRTPAGLTEYLKSPLDFFVGKFESPEVNEETLASAERRQPRSFPQHAVFKVIKPIENRIKQIHPRHSCCKHPHSCLHYVLKGFLRNFVFGYGAQACLNVLQFFRGRQKISSVMQSLMSLKTCNLGLFVGIYNALFRLCNCFLRWVANKDHSTSFGAVSGAIAGLASYFYKSSTISMYFLFKLFEVLSGKAVSKGWLPRFENADACIYAISLAIVLQAACIEPHNIRPGYWKFISGVSGGKFPYMFRMLLDDFGTNASQLYPDFIPNLDPKYVTSPRAMELIISSSKKGIL